MNESIACAIRMIVDLKDAAATFVSYWIWGTLGLVAVIAVVVPWVLVWRWLFG